MTDLSPEIKRPRPGDPVPCWRCQRSTPYQPPSSPDETLCDACMRLIDELREVAEKAGKDWRD